MKIRTRLYVNFDLKQGETISIVAPQLHFLKNVMRIKVGEHISIFNGRDGEFTAEILEVSNKFILAKCQEQTREQKNSSKIKLYFGSTNKHRLAFLVEKACELGATELQPIITEYGNKNLFNVDKMEIQAIEASEQCERLDIPTISPIIRLKDIQDSDTILFADESRIGSSLFDTLKDIKGKDISIIIGPAGGFSEEEKAFINSLNNVKNVNLGENILRVETAGIMILSCLKGF